MWVDQSVKKGFLSHCIAFAPLPPSVLLSLCTFQHCKSLSIQVFPAFVSLTTADPEWGTIVCE